MHQTSCREAVTGISQSERLVEHTMTNGQSANLLHAAKRMAKRVSEKKRVAPSVKTEVAQEVTSDSLLPSRLDAAKCAS
jgi:hypothetical protein